jgi:hypothetical protein
MWQLYQTPKHLGLATPPFLELYLPPYTTPLDFSITLMNDNYLLYLCTYFLSHSLENKFHKFENLLQGT